MYSFKYTDFSGKQSGTWASLVFNIISLIIFIIISEYKLVIICSIENEYRSPMISAFDKYRTPKIAVADIKNVQTYLKNKYTPADVRDTAVASDPIR